MLTTDIQRVIYLTYVHFLTLLKLNYHIILFQCAMLWNVNYVAQPLAAACTQRVNSILYDVRG